MNADVGIERFQIAVGEVSAHVALATLRGTDGADASEIGNENPHVVVALCVFHEKKLGPFGLLGIEEGRHRAREPVNRLASRHHSAHEFFAALVDERHLDLMDRRLGFLGVV
ncbi:MAG: hypothetical protein M5R36_23245 [Deltaproteobacteria bacterium]|nr:hypothetical protein [Deltaproteobacteria bacterium]